MKSPFEEIRELIDTGITSPKILHLKTNVPIRTINKYKRKILEEDNMEENNKKVKLGRKKIFNSNMRKCLRKNLFYNMKLSGNDLCNIINKKYGLNITPKTVTNELKNMGFIYQKCSSKFLLTSEHKKKRLEWCLSHRMLDLKKIIFTDEVTFQLFRNKLKVWRTKDSNQEIQTPKHPPKLHLWGSISILGKINFFIFKENMNSKLYINILKNNLLRKANRKFGDYWILQQDNDPKHRAKATISWISENIPDLLQWPSYSPDLNPIENIWAIMKRNIEKKNPKNLEELEIYIKNEWRLIDKKLCKTVIVSLHKRIEQCIDNNGDRIRK